MGVFPITPPDEFTTAACRWLGEGGAYTGPLPGQNHNLYPLLAGAVSGGADRLVLSGEFFRRQQTLQPVIDDLASRGIPVWTFKGFDLAETLYPFPGGRPMADIDLFVRNGDRQRVVEALRREGWTILAPGYGVFTSGIVSELKAFKNGILTEVHTHPFYFPCTFPGKLPRDLFLSWRELPGGVRGFAWHNALLLVVLHMMLNPGQRPVWWVDVFLLAGRVESSGTWEEFAVNASLSGLGSIVSAFLGVARDHLSCTVPDRVLNSLKRPSGREWIVPRLLGTSPLPTLTCLLCSGDWRGLSMLFPIFQAVFTRSSPLRSI